MGPAGPNQEANYWKEFDPSQAAHELPILFPDPADDPDFGFLGYNLIYKNIKDKLTAGVINFQQAEKLMYHMNDVICKRPDAERIVKELEEFHGAAYGQLEKPDEEDDNLNEDTFVDTVQEQPVDGAGAVGTGIGAEEMSLLTSIPQRTDRNRPRSFAGNTPGKNSILSLLSKNK